jgi:ribose transport system ATP-binding protein
MAVPPNSYGRPDPRDPRGRRHQSGAAPVPGALVVSNLSKTFPGTRALQSVSFAVRRGEVHALLGGNGSGKSTLVKVLAGVHQGDSGGTLHIGGTAVPADAMTPAKAREAGLRFVHQHPAVFPTLTVAENMAMGRGFETRSGGSIRWKAERRRTQELLDRFHIAASPTQELKTLRPSARTMVAIARALQDQEGSDTGLLVLDEPTAALPAEEVDLLLTALRRYADAGQTILFISHRLDEVAAFADRATVLRDGQLAGTIDRGEITHNRMVELITGRTIDRAFPLAPPITTSSVVLAARHLSSGPVHDVSFDLHRGEVLGIAGLLGSGRTELLRALFGAAAVRQGTIELNGQPAKFRDIGDAVARGIAYVPEDRAADAAFHDLSVTDNVTAASVRRHWRGGWLSQGQAHRDARWCIDRFRIRAHSERQPMNTLSGGNQQKAVLARWLEREPAVLLLDEPTQGVDVGARSDIYALVNDAVAQGAAAIVVSSDFEELSHVAHRVLVLADGRFVAEVRPPHLDPARLTQLSFAQEMAS